VRLPSARLRTRPLAGTAGAVLLTAAGLFVNSAHATWQTLPLAGKTQYIGHDLINIDQSRPTMCLQVGDFSTSAFPNTRGSLENGARIFTSQSGSGAPCTTSGTGNDQRWIFYDRGGRYQIRNLGTNKCLDVKDGNTSDGAEIQQWECNDSAASMRWSVNQIASRGPTGAPVLQIINERTGKCLWAGKPAPNPGIPPQRVVSSRCGPSSWDQSNPLDNWYVSPHSGARL
jgi:hypothetical protein